MNRREVRLLAASEIMSGLLASGKPEPARAVRTYSERQPPSGDEAALPLTSIRIRPQAQKEANGRNEAARHI
jgi:hypothetical protein